MSTTNGTAAIAACRHFGSVVVGSIANMTAVARAVDALDADRTLVLCAGTDGERSTDDEIAAGAIVDAIVKANSEKGIDTNVLPFAGEAHRLFLDHARDLESSLLATDHGRRLEQLGFADDVRFAAMPDRYSIVPQVTENRIFPLDYSAHSAATR